MNTVAVVQRVKETIILTAEYYGKALSAPLLKMYLEDLGDLQAEQICKAYRDWRKNPANKTFPLPAQIRELVCPEQFVSAEARAREIASRIVGAIPKFGWPNGKEAQAFIGPEGWLAVQQAGGWSYLCENLGRNLNPLTLKAQLREQIQGSLQYGQKAIEQSIGVLPAADRRGDLETLSNIVPPQIQNIKIKSEGA